MPQPEDRDPLVSALRAIPDHDDGIDVSPRVRAKLLGEVRSIARTRRRRRGAVFGSAVAILLVVAAGVWRSDHEPADQRAALDTPVDTAPGEVVTAFLPLTYATVPVTNVHLVRLSVPRTALASFGLASYESIGEPPSESVTAEVLVGDDGLARAVRFVQVRAN
jgi:hypothetical protein